ncbi:uncharacterized membrane protein YcjF (UPF0283 family) [Microbacterium marinum]|jgi:hypothetical protein|uniref:Uncharacterized membrane protein YcjF (UPF0283 family) n=1 Tax=Microbacterium marinum TaxID=421115 RepID=A0A7W7BS65_9MICO|nr:hypothetical protein [Microbacterium marinum]MBB4666826.1 uncharacterized membrane protein YcjF (UPF0283 family) [Microbacterium marinum]
MTDETTELLDITEVDAASLAEPLARARVRWAGIVWGLVLLTCAAGGLWLVSGADAIEAVQDWLFELQPSAAIAYVLLVIGAFVLVCGLIGLLRRAQRTRERG